MLRADGHVPPDGGAETLQPEAKVLFGKYQVGRLLGRGAFAKVYRARNVFTRQSVAIKCISKHEVLRCGLSSNIRREIAAMRRLHHPHIIRLYEVLASRSKIYFVLEFAKGGELFAHVANRGRLPEDAARCLFHQLVSAIAFCHARGVFHRDLKPENLLLGDQGDLKISDFDLSAVVSPAAGDRLVQTLCGTPAYVAPEVLSRRVYDGAKADIWSCGVILFVLTAGYLPFNHPNLMNLYRKICRGDYRCPRWTSPELRRLLSRLLDPNPETRTTVEGIVADPWFRVELDENWFLAMVRFREGLEDVEEERELNAFDIISFSTEFDISGLFDAAVHRERFVSGEPSEAILGRVEEVCRAEGLVVRRRKGKPGWAGSGAAVEDQTGNLVVWVKVHRLNRKLVMVEVEIGGEAEGNGEFWREKLRSVLKGGSVTEPATPVSC
ncbi:CBL-interacting serine/threonine-protein kinase 14-like [Phoenix dactylifera]|uniref:non-specific serine/threonine protein kinase n=1 Tax=Phoenix dactylifera TaxID=42345 RepID=A0A8B7C5U0_PHODC|nr:CBL-interacting serine/threonine-protein kinase 14-like [Phoenix dactylifera]